jgi:hypothetical protein
MCSEKPLTELKSTSFVMNGTQKSLYYIRDAKKLFIIFLFWDQKHYSRGGVCGGKLLMHVFEKITSVNGFQILHWGK